MGLDPARSTLIRPSAVFGELPNSGPLSEVSRDALNYSNGQLSWGQPSEFGRLTMCPVARQIREPKAQSLPHSDCQVDDVDWDI